MATRKPLVHIAGAIQELPAGDTLDGVESGATTLDQLSDVDTSTSAPTIAQTLVLNDAGIFVPKRLGLGASMAQGLITGDPHFNNVSLLLQFNGSDGSTVFTDSSANHVSVTRSGDAKLSTAQSKWGGSSGLFDGNGDYINIPSAAATLSGDFTVEAWVYLTSLGSYHPLLEARSAAAYLNFTMGIYNTGGVLRLDSVNVGGAGTRYTGSSTSVPLNTWTHVALVRSGGVIRGYVNGQQDAASATYSGDYTPGRTDVRIGSVLDPQYFYGYIDDFRITKGVARYTASFTPPTEAFPAYTTTPAATVPLLSDVDTITTPPTTGQGLVWDGDKWVPANLQPKDADLDAIAALTGTSGLLKKTAANTWALDTDTYLTSAAIGVTVQAYDADIPTVSASQAEMEAGTESALRSMSPLRVAQAVLAIAGRNTPTFGVKVFSASGTYSPTATGTHTVVVLGAGGSGAASSIAHSNAIAASGGGAGGFAVKWLTLSAGTTYTATVGAGGTAVSRSAAAGGIVGNAGGNSTFSGSGISTITANGGGAGGFGTTADVSGGAGGSASGGDINVTGGSGGLCTGSGRKASGGGAPGVCGVGYSAGTASSSTTAWDAATGGAGVGGSSGAATTTTAATATAGGGSAAPSSAATNAVGATDGYGSPSITTALFALSGVGGAAVISATPTGSAATGPGAGGGAAVGNSTGSATGGAGGDFGGGAAAGASSVSQNPAATAGAGGIGAGGGAAVCDGTATSGKGGDGLIIVMWGY